MNFPFYFFNIRDISMKFFKKAHEKKSSSLDTNIFLKIYRKCKRKKGPRSFFTRFSIFLPTYIADINIKTIIQIQLWFGIVVDLLIIFKKVEKKQTRCWQSVLGTGSGTTREIIVQYGKFFLKILTFVSFIRKENKN